MPQIPIQQQIRPTAQTRMGIPMNMPFRPAFQQTSGPPQLLPGLNSPQISGQSMVPPRNFNIDQLQNLMIAQQRYIANRTVGFDQSQISSGQSIRPQIQQRNQIQSDISTAAAFTALNNAQSVEKKVDEPAPEIVKSPTPIIPSVDEVVVEEKPAKRKKTSEAVSPALPSSSKKLAPPPSKKPRKRVTPKPTSRASRGNRRISKAQLTETESSEEEIEEEEEEEEEEDELEEEEDELESELEEAIPEPPKKTRASRGRSKKK